jgi:hypothetical protein
MKILVTPDKVTPFHPLVLCYLHVGNPGDPGVAWHGNNVGTTDHKLNRAVPPAILKTESWIALIICDHIYLSGICDVVLTLQR